MPEPAERVIRFLRLVALAQLVGFLLVIAGMAFLAIDLVHNNSLDCAGFGFAGTGAGECARRSYAWPVGLLIGGFGLTVVAVFVTTQYTLKHVGTPMVRALLARRRLLDGQAESRSTDPSSTS